MVVSNLDLQCITEHGYKALCINLRIPGKNSIQLKLSSEKVQIHLFHLFYPQFVSAAYISFIISIRCRAVRFRFGLILVIFWFSSGMRLILRGKVIKVVSLLLVHQLVTHTFPCYSNKI